jgi:hypothetical protein
MENERLFAPGGRLTPEQAHQVWHTLVRRFVQATRGRVTIFASSVVPGSVFEIITLPELRANPNVTLDFK